MIPGRLTHVAGSYREVIRSPSYFPLWLSQLVSSFGDTPHYIALVVLVYQLTGQGAVPDQVRGRVFTLLDVSWNAMRLLSLALGAVVVDAIGVQPLFWIGGASLAGAGILGLVLLGNHDFQPQ